MLDRLYQRLGNLLTIKSLVTMALTIVFALLAVRGKIQPDQLLTVYTVVIGFYFGTQAERPQPPQ